MSHPTGTHDLVEEVAVRLGAVDLQRRDYGVTKSVVCSVEGRGVEVLLGRALTIEVDLHLPGVPPSVSVSFAPEGLYDRAKLLEGIDPSTRPVTGNEDFDRLFVVLGDHGADVTKRLAGAWSAMVDAAELRPSLEQLKLVPGQAPELRPYLRARPELGADGELTPESGAAAVRATIGLAATLERAWTAG